jgi:hypothetical protein
MLFINYFNFEKEAADRVTVMQAWSLSNKSSSGVTFKIIRFYNNKFKNKNFKRISRIFY